MVSFSRHQWAVHLLSIAVLVIIMFINDSTYAQKTYRHYPEKIHKMVKQKIEELHGKTRHGRIGSWGNWGPWSQCSRSCGTGVATQQRKCLPNRHKAHVKGRLRCIGISKRFQLCNTQMCRGRAMDFRAEQCKSFNNKVFNKQVYSWQPYIDGGKSCTLNCKPKGFSFYATLNQTVIDGTPCGHYKKVPDRICVEGKCLVVGCDGILGSGQVLDACGMCGGFNDTCQIIAGNFYERHLPYGYNLIATLPPGSENISILHMKPSNNFLAVRELGGRYVINGPGRRSYGYSLAGRPVFTYTKGNRAKGDRLLARGPLIHSVDIMLFNKEPNLGIKYEYKIPNTQYHYARKPPTSHIGTQNRLFMLADGPFNRKYPNSSNAPNSWALDPTQFLHPYDRSNAIKSPWVKSHEVSKSFATSNTLNSIAYSNAGVINDGKTHFKIPKTKHLKSQRKPKKHRKFTHKYSWFAKGYSACSQSCGTGTQVTRFVCVKKKKKRMEVPTELCSSVLPPSQQIRNCNSHPCPPQWQPGKWGSCSVTCGLGVQLRNVTCQRNLPGNQITVSNEECHKSPPEPTAQVCELRQCDGTPEWETGIWSRCSVDCGLGLRKRTVTCSTAFGVVNDWQCRGQKPVSEELCDMGSCSKNTWFFSDWENWCNGPCGEGVYKRQVFCSTDHCDQRLKPPTTKSCEPLVNQTLCNGKWFTSSWSKCDASSCLNPGFKYRTVVCVAWHKHKYRVLHNEKACSKVGKKPEEIQECNVPCKSQWIMSQWSQCSMTCGGGVQRREIKCFNANQFGDCSRDQKPDSRQRCNSKPCRHENEVPIYREYMQKKIQYMKSISDSDECLDRMKNCKLVLKARLCKLQYYSKLCCQTCQY